MKIYHILVPALLASTTVFAADMTNYNEPAPARFDWSGFYIGVHGGYGTGSTHARTTLHDAGGAPLAPTAHNSFDGDGFLGGVQAGYNWQINNVVFGVEGEYSAADVHGDFNFDPARPEAIAGGKMKAIADFKARLGYAFDRTLVFATGGYAIGWNKGFANNVFDPAPAVDHASGSDTLNGFVIGAGVERALTDHITIKAEYDYFHFSRGDFQQHSAAYPAGVALQTEPKSDLHTFKIAVNYKF